MLKGNDGFSSTGAAWLRRRRRRGRRGISLFSSSLIGHWGRKWVRG